MDARVPERDRRAHESAAFGMSFHTRKHVNVTGFGCKTTSIRFEHTRVYDSIGNGDSVGLAMRWCRCASEACSKAQSKANQGTSQRKQGEPWWGANQERRNG